MSEKYVKEILDKLEEIEKLHAKLRNLVPRAKNGENKSKADRRRSTNVQEGRRSVVRETGEKKMNSAEEKPAGYRHGSLGNVFKNSAEKGKRIIDPFVWSAKYIKQFRNRSSNEFKRIRTNSVDYVTKQWREKNGRVKSFLASMNEPDIILVTRAVQTIDGEVNIFSEAFQKRRSTAQNISKWLLDHFDSNGDSNDKNGCRASVEGRGLGNNEPRTVKRTLFIPDKETETLKILSNARRVSVSENKKQPSSGSRARKLSGKFTDIRLE